MPWGSINSEAIGDGEAQCFFVGKDNFLLLKFLVLKQFSFSRWLWSC